MGQTIDGGRYRNPDGSWKDAWGNPLPPPEEEPSEEESSDKKPATDDVSETDDASEDEPADVWDEIPRAEKLRAAGYDTLAVLAQATDEELRAVDGIGPATVDDIRALLRETE